MNLRSVFYVLAISYGVLSCNKSKERPDNVSSYNDIYLAGSEDNSSGNSIAKYWKNNTATNLTDGSMYAEAFDIFVTDNNDVYVAGYEEIGAGMEIGKYWKNGVAVNLTSGVSYGGAYSILVSNNDVYVAGYDKNNCADRL